MVRNIYSISTSAGKNIHSCSKISQITTPTNKPSDTLLAKSLTFWVKHMQKLRIEITDYETVEEPYWRTIKVKRVVELTEWELAVAIMADSIGYACPEHAMRHVKDFIKGEKYAYCERGCAIFGADLEKLIKSAAYYWYKTDPEKRERLKAFAESWRKLEEKDPIAGWSVSMLYPTLNI